MPARGHGQYTHLRQWKRYKGYERLQRLPYLTASEAHRLLHRDDPKLTRRTFRAVAAALGIHGREWDIAYGVPLMVGKEPWDEAARLYSRGEVEQVRRSRYLGPYDPRRLPAQARRTKKPCRTPLVSRIEELLQNRWTCPHDVYALRDALVAEGFARATVHHTLQRLIAVGQLRYEPVRVAEAEPWAYHTVPRLHWADSRHKLRAAYAPRLGKTPTPVPTLTCDRCGATKQQSAFIRRKRQNVCKACKRDEMVQYAHERHQPWYDALRAEARCAFCLKDEGRVFIKNLHYKAQVPQPVPLNVLFRKGNVPLAEILAEVRQREMICARCYRQVADSAMYKAGLWKENSTRTQWEPIFAQIRAKLRAQYGTDFLDGASF